MPAMCRMPRRVGGMTNTTPVGTLPLVKAARCLAVPAPWLREEVEAGRLPGLVAGKAVLVHVPSVRTILDERARGEAAAMLAATPEGGAA